MNFFRIIIVLLMACMPFMNTFGKEIAKKKPRIMVICAHPDDVELTSGGTLSLLAKHGYEIKSVSVTNGNKGHHEGTKEQVAARRWEEMKKVEKLLGCSYEVLGIEDGELEANLENRMKIIRLIREWNPDIVITHPPYDYHPDHRNTSILVQDASFLVTVPKLLPEVPAIKQNPLFLYTRGRYVNPIKPQPDIVVDISSVIEDKARLIDAHASQVYEWLPWINHLTEPIPSTQQGKIDYLVDTYVLKRGVILPQDREVYEKWYRSPSDKTKAIEAFEICEFGRAATDELIRMLFPMFSQH